MFILLINNQSAAPSWSGFTRGRQFSGTPDSPDIVTGLTGIQFEVKRAESLAIYAAIEQAMKDAGENVPVVLHRKNNKPWLAIMRLDDLPRLAALISTAKHHP